MESRQNPQRRVHALLGNLAPTRAFAEKRRHRQHDKILQRTFLLTNDQEIHTYKYAGDSETKTQTNQNENFGNLTLTENNIANETKIVL